MKIIATLVGTKDLKPGDLFSAEGPEYWESRLNWLEKGVIGERVFIRTNVHPKTGYVEGGNIFKITIETTEDEEMVDAY